MNKDKRLLFFSLILILIMVFLILLLVLKLAFGGVLNAFNAIHGVNNRIIKVENHKKSNSESVKENGLEVYRCDQKSQIYIQPINENFINMTLVHPDDTYSSITLKKKISDNKRIVYADEYDIHKLWVSGDVVDFTIHDKDMATNCKFLKMVNLEEASVPIVDAENLDEISDRMDYMFYGDPALDRVVIMKLSTFEKVAELKIDGENVYCVDHVTDDKSYVIPRGSNFLQIIERNGDKFTLGKKIDLPFYPRTGAKNKFLKLELVSSKDKPMFALIDINTDEVLYSDGKNKKADVKAVYGGANATGHAKWISAEYFVFPDRDSKTVSLYEVSQKKNKEFDVKKLDEVKFPTTAHTFFDVKRIADGNYKFYATLEGDDNQKNAGITELQVKDGKLSVLRTVNVSGGVHHAEAHPTQDLIYVPTGNGFLDIVDEKTFKVIKTLKVGKGAGHVVWVQKKNLALVINHLDTFLSVIDSKNHEKVKDIEVAKDNPKYDTLLQSHSTRLSPDDRYYYGFATDNGTFFRVDLDKLEVDKEIYVGGTPKQASQPSELND